MSRNKFKWDAKDYNKHSGTQQKWAMELIDKLSLSGDERVLDIGCGDGKITAKIAMGAPKGKVVGIDGSREMVDFCIANYEKDMFPNLIFKHIDMREMDFEDDFDIVFSNAAIHWVKDHRPILEKIARAMTPSGRTMLQMGGQGNAAAFIDIVEKLIAVPPWLEYFKDFNFPYGFYGPEEYTKWTIDAGLIPKRIELIKKT